MEPLPELTDAELKLARQLLCEQSPNIIAFLARIQKLIKTALNESDAMLRAEIVAAAKMIEQADPVLNEWGSRIDRAKMEEQAAVHRAVVNKQPAIGASTRPPLKRGPGIRKIVTSQRRDQPSVADVFDYQPPTSKLSDKARQAMFPADDDDEIPMEFDSSDRNDAFRND